MTDITPPIPAPAEPSKGKGLFARIVGVFVSPRATFAAVAARPRALGVLVIGLAVVVLGIYALLSTEVGQQAWLDQQVQQREAFGQTIPDEQYRGMERIAPYVGYIAAAGYVIVIPIFLAILSGKIGRAHV